jgi:hypothetical protein
MYTNIDKNGNGGEITNIGNGKVIAIKGAQNIEAQAIVVENKQSRGRN